MIAVLRSEWIKLHTVRMNYVLVSIAIAFPLIVTVLTAIFIDPGDIGADDLVGLVTGTSVITGMLLGVIGAAGITGEFGFGTIRPTFAATPKRMRVVTAKIAITVVVAMVVEAVVVALAYTVASTILSSRDIPVSLADAEQAWPAMIGIVLFAAIVSLLGFGLGLLLRNTPGSVAVLILWPLVGENIVGALLYAVGLEHPFKWLPYTAGINLGSTNVTDDAETLGRVVGGLYFFAVSAAVTAVGAFLVNRRDA